MKILLLGGTGAMGVHLTEILKNKKIDTYITSRKAKKSSSNIHYIQGNAKKNEFLKKILSKEKWDAIIDFMVYDTNTFKERLNLLLNNTKQYLFLSSARVYADCSIEITERSPRLLDVTKDHLFLNTDEYSLTKSRQENLLKNSKYSNWTIIRPYITYSEKRLQLGVLEKEEWLYRALQGKTIVFCKEMMEKETTLTYGLDVAKGIAQLIGEPKALKNTFHITNNHSIKWGEVFSIYLSLLNKQLGYTPKVLLLDLKKFTKCKNAQYQIKYDRLYNRKFNNQKINNHIDTSTFIGVKEGLELCLTTFLLNPQFNAINWKEEALKDKQTKEHTPLSKIIGFKPKIKYILFRYFPLFINKLI